MASQEGQPSCPHEQRYLQLCSCPRGWRGLRATAPRQATCQARSCLDPRDPVREALSSHPLVLEPEAGTPASPGFLSSWGNSSITAVLGLWFRLRPLSPRSGPHMRLAPRVSVMRSTGWPSFPLACPSRSEIKCPALNLEPGPILTLCPTRLPFPPAPGGRRLSACQGHPGHSSHIWKSGGSSCGQSPGTSVLTSNQVIPAGYVNAP